MSIRYRPTLLRRDSVSSRWTQSTEKPKEVAHEVPPPPPSKIPLPSGSTLQSAGQAAAQLAALRRRFPDLSKDEISELIDQFTAIPSSKVGWITQSTAFNAAQAKENVSYNRARDAMKSILPDATDKVGLEEWIEFMSHLRSEQPEKMTPGSRSGTFKMRGSHNEIQHSLDEDERVGIIEYINTALASDPDVGSRLPLPTDTMQIFDECKDGLIICKLIDHIFPGTIDSVMGVRRRRGTTYINLPSNNHALNKFQIAENNNIAILAAEAIGVNVVNMSAQDIAEGREHLILSLVGQIIRQGTSDKPRPMPPKQSYRPVTPNNGMVRRASLSAPVRPRSRQATSPPPYSHPRSMSRASVRDDDEDVPHRAASVSGHQGDKTAERITQLQLKSKMMERGTFKLFEDLKGGIIILETLEKITPETKVKAPASRVGSRPSSPPGVRRHETTPMALPYKVPAPKRTLSNPDPRPVIIGAKEKQPIRPVPAAKEAPMKPSPPPLIIPGKDLVTSPVQVANYGIDEGIIAQRRALLYSIKSRG
ncbi:SubName: Full=Probable SAC6-actin filament bundling protein, fimbrin {ECO:0000313/EMBL:CCA71837.1} [Serendipita indica DSM 11827]|nr:SubName: Full=Probable SAC6-actin filament bundling protein, fimbrin {ECO:0000313/EMBL:CCA71837.1} [Serendipita indica DSM 11827]